MIALSVQERIEDNFGAIVEVELLRGGLSGAAIYRLHVPQRTLILKSAAKAAEAYFYRQIAPVLRVNDVPVPDCYLLHEADGDPWLLLEDIPDPLPRSRWQGDPEIAAVLARLHKLAPETIPQMPPGMAYVPAWEDSLSEKALACFEESVQRDLRPRLVDLREGSQHLFGPVCALSGDCNPTNWGLRRDGSAVLFDWERFTLGSPAIDLAITIGGLSSRERYAALAGYYLQARPDYDASQEQLTRDLLLAKTWIIVEFLSLYTDGLLQPDETLTMLINTFVEWLDSLAL